MRGEQLTVYRGCTPVVDKQYENDGDETPVQTVVGALAEAEGVDATDLPPLFETIDPDALNRLFHNDDESEREETMLSFTIDNWNVFVRADGLIRVCDGTEPTEPEPVFENWMA